VRELRVRSPYARRENAQDIVIWYAILPPSPLPPPSVPPS
jgi:hypothetical protein